MKRCGTGFSLWVLLALAPLAQAQVASGALLGDVLDESSALVPKVVITAVHDATGFSRAALSGSEGAYRLEGLPPGTYTVTAKKPGFRAVEISGVAIEVSQKLRLDIELKVGDASETVTVAAETSPVRTEDASLGYQLDAGAIRGLPLARRNVTALITLGPGAVPRHLGGFTHDVVNDVQEGPRGAVALNPPVNGARSTMNAFLLDGAYVTDRNTYAIALLPPMEAVEEFRIQSSQATAEFAQAGGAVVDLVTRSGTRDFHGSALEYFRNEAADARNFFDDPALPRPIFRQHQFGGSAGGPLPSRNTFFFGAYEGLRGKSAKAAASIVPDAALRGGDFTGRNPILDPLADPRTPFPGNRIPADRIDPISARYLERYEPLPNRASPTGNYLDSTPNQTTMDSVSARVDRQFRDQSSLFARYSMNREQNRIAGSFPVLPAFERVRAQQAVGAYARSGARWLNELRLSFTRLRLFDVPESAFKTNVARELGLADAPDDPAMFGLPFFLVTNFSTVLDSPSLPQIQRDNIWHVSNGVSIDRGRRTWKFGADVIRFNMAYMQSNLSRGQYIFTGAFTADPASPGTGDAFADFLLGFPQETRRSLGNSQAYLVQNSYSAYVQQDWRVNRALTLNLGARYEYVSPFREKRGNLLNLDYSGLPAAPRLASSRTAVEPDRNNLAPRVGLALRLPEAPGRDLVFRAGYGVYYSPEIAVETYDLVLNGIRNETNETDGSRSPVLTIRDGFPRTASTGLPSYFGLDRDARMPYVQQWTAGFQRSLPGRVLAEVAYMGAKGTKLGRFRQFNTPLRVVTGENLPPRPGNLQSLRPFPELGPIVQRQHISNSSYHSLQFKAEKRFARSLGLLASFVWSKSIDDADSVIPGQFDSVGAQDERNLRLERGLSFFHVGRRLSAGFVYAVPRSGVRPLRNWELSGVVTLQDGTPLNPVYFAFDGANSGTHNRPDVVPGESVRLPRSERTADRFFNTNAFRTPEPHRFGNAGRNILPGPGNNLVDLALSRKFPLSERHAIECRVESFNVFNHPNWGIPGPYPDFGPFFGKILSTGEPRRMQAVLRFSF